ncbi:hypothetical protein NLJ89_g5684 [Agrocybe chaxingu]|uniref:Uncharacterized protein n=1 Tax=Agrocybe chaxingu TaxID=84603 RepID=A0A9W8MVD4_9AGAR|nr:hypothetical protein NLJ89_g5684 [Agrocybe chaxingu]
MTSRARSRTFSGATPLSTQHSVKTPQVVYDAPVEGPTSSFNCGVEPRGARTTAGISPETTSRQPSGGSLAERPSPRHARARQKQSPAPIRSARPGRRWSPVKKSGLRNVYPPPSEPEPFEADKNHRSPSGKSRKSHPYGNTSPLGNRAPNTRRRSSGSSRSRSRSRAAGATRVPSPTPSEASTKCSADADLESIPSEATRQRVFECVKKCYYQGAEGMASDLFDRGTDTIPEVMETSDVLFRVLKYLRNVSIPSTYRDAKTTTNLVALLRFTQFWKKDGLWVVEARLIGSTGVDAHKGASLAVLMARLFVGRVLTGLDVFYCLKFLLNHEPHHNRLCAIHVMVSHLNYRIGKKKYWANFQLFATKLSAVINEWGASSEDHFLVQDIIGRLNHMHEMAGIKKSLKGLSGTT